MGCTYSQNVMERLVEPYEVTVQHFSVTSGADPTQKVVAHWGINNPTSTYQYEWFFNEYTWISETADPLGPLHSPVKNKFTNQVLGETQSIALRSRFTLGPVQEIRAIPLHSLQEVLILTD